MNESKTLTAPALDVIKSYLRLPFSDKMVTCPYHNNWYAKVRGGLRVLIGKGSPKEIVEEAELIALREKVSLNDMSNDQIKKFLVDHHLGIDCSGLVYYILEAEQKAQGQKKSLAKTINFPFAKNPLRRLIIKLRPIENINVLTLAHTSNSKEVALAEIKPGDLLIIIKSTAKKDCDHVLIVHQVDYENGQPKTIYYTHALQWSIDGQYNHGIRQGQIDVMDGSRPLLDQNWTESGQSGSANETFVRAQKAKDFSIRRLRKA